MSTEPSETFCCQDLDEHLGEPNRCGAGLHALVTMNVKTLKRRIAIVYLMTPGARKLSQGTAIKFCPFCGTDLLGWFKNKRTEQPVNEC